MSKYEYRVAFYYGSAFIGAVVSLDEQNENRAIALAVKTVWETNGIDVDIKNCESVKVTLMAIISEEI